MKTKNEFRIKIKNLLDTNLSSIKKIQLQKTLNILESGKIYDKLIRNFINIGIPDDISKSITDHLILNTNDAANVLKNISKPPIDLQDIVGKYLDISSLLYPYGISKNTSTLLASYKWSSSPATGIGELIFSMFLKNAHKASSFEHGDIIVNNDSVEVKGKEARLIGQRGFGDAPSVATYIRKKLKEIKQQYNLDVYLPEDHTQYNFYKTSKKPWIIENVSKALYEQANSNPMIVCDIISNALLLLYTEASYKDIFLWVANHINTVGAFDRDNFIYDFFKFSLEYYQKIEGFKYLILVNKTQFLLIEPKNIKDYLDKITISCPSFNIKAGVQGKAFGITLKLNK